VNTDVNVKKISK